MIIEPIIQGVVARSAHPAGCAAAVRQQIAYVEGCRTPGGGTGTAPKKVLILGGSSGFGLASRIALAFGDAQADTIAVSFERGANDKGVGTAGWYNNIAFNEAAKSAGRIAKNFVGDAFSADLREAVARYIEDEFGGQVDLVIYSLATGARPNPETGELWRSAIKTLDAPYTGFMLDLEREALLPLTVEPATAEERFCTEKVMGGEDWEAWIRFLAGRGLLAAGAMTLSYSYIGSEINYPIYHHGTLGAAKRHLHATADTLDDFLSETVGGSAYAVVCKALVTKASVFIPGLSPYLLALFRVHKALGLHEGPIEQMQRLFGERLAAGLPETDAERLVRIDDWELRPDVQAQVLEILSRMTPDNFRELGDYAGFRQAFMELNGFEVDGVDYAEDVDLEALRALQP